MRRPFTFFLLTLSGSSMSHACAECGASTVWDDEAASQICTSCGTLADPSQSQLDDSNAHGNLFLPATLKSVRLGSNWDLAGQGKEARERKNKVGARPLHLAVVLSNAYRPVRDG